MKKKVRIYKSPDGNGKYINKTAQFLERMDYGGQPSVDELGYPGAVQETQADPADQLAQVVLQDINDKLPYEASVAKLVNAYDLDPAVANQFVQQIYATVEAQVDKEKSDETETEEEAEPKDVEEIGNEIVREKKPMSKIRGNTDLAMDDSDEDDEGLGDEDMLKYGGMPRKDNGGEADYVEAMNNDQTSWPASETPIVMPDVSEYIPFDMSDYLSNDAAAIAWSEPTDEDMLVSEDESDYTEPVVNPDEFRMGGFKTKKGYVNSILKLVKKSNGGDTEEQDIKASDADPRGDDLRKNRLDAFVGAVKREGNASIAKQKAEEQFEEMQAMHNQMMQNPNLQNFIPEGYDNQEYMQFGGQRRAMRQLNRAMRRMPVFPGMYGPVTKFDVRRSGIFGKPKEYSIEFGESPLMQLAGNPFLSQAYGYGYSKKKTKTPGRLITETVRNTVNNKSTKDVAKATNSEAASKSVNVDMDNNTIPDNIQRDPIQATKPNSTLPSWITDPIGTAITSSRQAQPSVTPEINAVEDYFKKNPPRVGETNSAYLLRTTGNPGFYNNTDVWNGTEFVKTKKETTVVQPKTGPVVKSVPKPVEENKNTTTKGIEWTVSKKDSAPQEEFCYGEKCFSFPEEQQDDAFSFYDMPDVLRNYDMSNFNNLTKDELKKLMKESKHSFLSRQNIDTPEYDRFADAWLKYQKARLANYPKDKVITNRDLFDQSAKDHHQAADAYSDFLNQYGKFKPGDNPNDIYKAIGPLSPDYEKYQGGGPVNNPFVDPYGNLQKFISGGYDPSQGDIDDVYSKDVTDPYFQYGGLTKYVGDEEGSETDENTNEYEDYRKRVGDKLGMSLRDDLSAKELFEMGNKAGVGFGKTPTTTQKKTTTTQTQQYNPYASAYGYNPQSLFQTYFPANFPQRHQYLKKTKGAYNKNTGEMFKGIPGFNPYAQVQNITGKGRRFSVTYNTNPTGKPEDRKLAFATPGSQQEQQKQQGIANKSTQPKAGFSNTAGLSNKAQRQIRQGEREMMRNERKVARNPEGKVPFMLNAPGKVNQAGPTQKQYGGVMEPYLPIALYGTESPVSMVDNPMNTDLKLPTKSSKEVGQQLMTDSKKKLEGEANYMPDEYTVDYKAKSKWFGGNEGMINTINAGARGVAGMIDRFRNKDREAKMYENLTADNLYASDPSLDRGDYSVTGSDYGLYRSPDQGQTWGSRSAQYGGTSNYSEGDEVEMTEEELEQFLANGGEVEYLNY